VTRPYGDQRKKSRFDSTKGRNYVSLASATTYRYLYFDGSLSGNKGFPTKNQQIKKIDIGFPKVTIQKKSG